MGNKPTAASTAQANLAIIRCSPRGADVATPATRQACSAIAASLSHSRVFIRNARPQGQAQALAQSAMLGIISDTLMRLERYPAKTRQAEAWARLIASYAASVNADNRQLCPTASQWQAIFHAARCADTTVRQWCLAATYPATPQPVKRARNPRQSVPHIVPVSHDVRVYGTEGDGLRIDLAQAVKTRKR